MEEVKSRPESAEAGFYERSIAMMRAEGFKITPQRCAILELFHHHSDHLTPQEIYQLLGDDVASLSLATVYNSLEIFAKVGILTRFCTDHGQTYYDPNPTPHHHAICNQCEAIYDLEINESTMSQLMSVLQEEGLGTSQSFRIHETKLWFRGLCNSCQ